MFYDELIYSKTKSTIVYIGVRQNTAITRSKIVFKTKQFRTSPSTRVYENHNCNKYFVYKCKPKSGEIIIGPATWSSSLQRKKLQ